MYWFVPEASAASIAASIHLLHSISHTSSPPPDDDDGTDGSSFSATAIRVERKSKVNMTVMAEWEKPFNVVNGNLRNKYEQKADGTNEKKDRNGKKISSIQVQYFGYRTKHIFICIE